MGEFINMVAVRDADAARVAGALARYATAHGVASARVSDPDWGDVILSATGSGWTVFEWPLDAVGKDEPAARWLSANLGTIASCVFVYDGDYWSHVLFAGGAEVDRFTSDAGYWGEEEPGHPGDPAAVAAAMGVPVETVAPYFVQPEEQLGRAFPDDEHELGSIWVFVDFWRRLGISYAGDRTGEPVGVDMSRDWEQALP